MAKTASEVLNNFGTAILPNGSVVFTDVKKAENGYIRHSEAPAAAMAFTLISPTFARGRFPRLLLRDIIAARPSMDISEITALANLCGQEIAPDFSHKDFIRHLYDVISRKEIQPLFCRYTRRPACWGIDVRPIGVNWDTEEWDRRALNDWRQAYNSATPPLQMLIASLMWLYRGANSENEWLKCLPHKWHVAEALPVMKDAGLLGDWAKLVATYQGW